MKIWRREKAAWRWRKHGVIISSAPRNGDAPRHQRKMAAAKISMA